jgi:hypothetical protein
MKLVGCVCVAMAHNNTHVNYLPKRSQDFVLRRLITIPCPPRRHARRKAKSKTDSLRTCVGRLVAAIVNGGNRLGRKNRMKARKTNGMSDDGENDGARML